MVIESAIGSALTLYMLAIVVRWAAPWLEFDLGRGYWRLIPRMTDPLLERLRKKLPPLGTMDWAPIAALFLVWVIRLILVGH